MGSLFVLWWVFVLLSYRWKYNVSGEKLIKNNEKKVNEYFIKNYLFFLVWCKRNVFVSRVGDCNVKLVFCKCISLWKYFCEEKKK